MTRTVTIEEARALERSLWSEAKFQRELIALAKSFGWLVYHTRDSRRSQKGYPDLTIVRGRRIVFAELKRQKGRISTEQLLWLTALHTAGCEAYEWRPGDWDAILEVLR